MTHSTQRALARIKTGQRMVRAWLYLPANRPHAPALVIFHRLHHLGTDEPRLASW